MPPGTRRPRSRAPRANTTSSPTERSSSRSSAKADSPRTARSCARSGSVPPRAPARRTPHERHPRPPGGHRADCSREPPARRQGRARRGRLCAARRRWGPGRADRAHADRLAGHLRIDEPRAPGGAAARRDACCRRRRSACRAHPRPAAAHGRSRRRRSCGGRRRMTALLRAHELTKTFGSVRALDGVNFEIDEGITGLLGSNGAGKSTSLKLFLGLLDPDSGAAEVLGQDARSSPDVRARIGYAPEHDCLPRNVSAAEFLAYMAQVSGLPRTAARLRASDVLRHVGLFEERYRPMETYSTGMKQRVKLAQALVHDPVIALLDEPTAGLDPLGRREMLELIRRVGGEFGISIVISTHLMGDVERACDSVVVLDAGRLLRSGPVSGFTEETETLEVELLDGAEAVVAALRSRGLEPTVGPGGRRLTLEAVSGEDYDTLRDVIVDSGALLYRLAPARHSLADVFTSDADPAREEAAS